MQDQSLIRAAKGGDESAVVRLMTGMLPFIRQKAAQAAAAYALDAEDLVQEGLIGFLGAVRSFADGEASFSTYACTCILNSIRSAVRRANRVGTVPASALVPIDDAAEVRAEGPDDPQDIIVGNDEAMRLRRNLYKHLSQREQEVLRLYLAGGSYADIAASLSLKSSKTVDNTLQRIRKKLKSFSS